MRSLRIAAPLMFAVLLPLMTGAKGDGCAARSKSPAPDVTGTWDIAYDDIIGVKINIGGTEYNADLGPNGGMIEIMYQGVPIQFNLDCARPEILCPSEAWPESVDIEQRNTEFEHQMIVTLPIQTCSVPLRQPAASECGADTLNPNCEPVCDGQIMTHDEERFGVIGETGDTFRLYLGAGLATNGINCALLAWSVADASLTTEGKGTADWVATDMTAGAVEIGYAGGCLWVAQTDMDPQLEAAILSASIQFTTGFTGTRAP